MNCITIIGNEITIIIFCFLIITNRGIVFILFMDSIPFKMMLFILFFDIDYYIILVLQNNRWNKKKQSIMRCTRNLPRDDRKYPLSLSSHRMCRLFSLGGNVDQ